MTVILGHRFPMLCCLASDSRRRDHVTGTISRVRKLHKWSEELIFAQGGAGTGAADLVVQSLFEKQSSIGESIGDVSKYLSSEAPALIEPAHQRWEDAGQVMPPTYIILCSVDPNTRTGQHRSIDLKTGITKFESSESGPYMTGSNTPLIIEVVSEQFHHQMPTGDGELCFDQLVAESVAELEKRAGADIGGPADIGYVRLCRDGTYTSEIVQNFSVNNESNGKFRGAFAQP